MFATWSRRKGDHQQRLISRFRAAVATTHCPHAPPSPRRRCILPPSSSLSLCSRDVVAGGGADGRVKGKWLEGDEREAKMRTICDVCESAPAVLFCAADEAALCRPCDEKVHMCNKLASRHVRVGLADPSEVPRCDICENAPAFFYCEIDGSSLCLQCDMIVHVGGKRTHGRYLLHRQRVEFPGDKTGHADELTTKAKESVEHRRDQKMVMKERASNHKPPSDPTVDANNDNDGNTDSKMIDLNTRPVRIHQQASNTQAQQMDIANDNNHDSAGVGLVPTGSFPSNS